MAQDSRVAGGDVYLPLDEAEWWGSALAVLVAAVHHPHLLTDAHPRPEDVARQVLAGLSGLRSAATCAGEEREVDAIEVSRRASVRCEGDEIAFSPGSEVASLAWCLEIFAEAVLEPDGRSATIARGATGYAASAWSRDIGKASGAL